LEFVVFVIVGMRNIERILCRKCFEEISSLYIMCIVVLFWKPNNYAETYKVSFSENLKKFISSSIVKSGSIGHDGYNMVKKGDVNML
jgi:hypothetical protein